MGFGICFKFSTNLAQSRFCSFSRLDLTSNWMLSCLFRIWWKISFDSLLTYSANMIAFFWPHFLYWWNFFHHVSKMQSAGGDTSANVDLSIRNEECNSVNKERAKFASQQGKNSILTETTFILRFHQFSLRFGARHLSPMTQKGETQYLISKPFLIIFLA